MRKAANKTCSGIPRASCKQPHYPHDLSVILHNEYLYLALI